MNKIVARRIADSLTWARIWSAIPITLVAWLGFKWWVLGLYVVAALTDLFDGWFGRRATPPEKDTDFDGRADLLMSVMTLLWIWLLFPWFFPKYWLPYLPILVAIEIYLLSIRWRFPDLHVPHFEFGRWAMALFFFLLPVLLVFGDQPYFVHFVFIVGTISKMQLAWHFAVRPDDSSQAAPTSDGH